MNLNFLCPNCQVISAIVPEERTSQPVEMPGVPTGLGHWARLYFDVKFRDYQLDHWNEAVTCPNCGKVHTYWKEVGKDVTT